MQFKDPLAQNYMGPHCLHDLRLGSHLQQAGAQGGMQGQVVSSD